MEESWRHLLPPHGGCGLLRRLGGYGLLRVWTHDRSLCGNRTVHLDFPSAAIAHASRKKVKNKDVLKVVYENCALNKTRLGLSDGGLGAGLAIIDEYRSTLDLENDADRSALFNIKLLLFRQCGLGARSKTVIYMDRQLPPGLGSKRLHRTWKVPWVRGTRAPDEKMPACQEYSAFMRTRMALCARSQYRLRPSYKGHTDRTGGTCVHRRETPDAQPQRR